MHERAGTVALPEDLTDIDALISAYYDIEPDPSNPDQRVSFGTSGHRGSAFDGKFNEAHIVAITQAIVDYRAEQGFNGPLFIGRDTHALSEPAWRTALEVLAAHNVDVRIDARGSYTPTPAVSVAILGANGAPKHLRTTGEGLADGIVVTPSHNPPRDGGFKYNPPHGGPADSDATSWIAKRANEILEKGWRSVDRVLGSDLLDHPSIHRFDYLAYYVDQLDQVIDIDAIREAGVRIGADPLGGASVDYWGAIAERYGLELTVVNPKVDPAWSFMTLDWDGKIRMDCSSPYAMASLRDAMTPDENGNTPYDIATGNDADSDRHGIVTPDGLMNPNHYLAVATYSWNTGDTAALAALSDDMSGFAHSLMNKINNDYSNGWVYGKSLTVDHVLLLEPVPANGSDVPPNTIGVKFSVTAVDGTKCSGTRIAVRNEEYQSTISLFMTWQENRWVETQGRAEADEL